MGLLDGNLDLEDPKTQGLLTLALGLLAPRQAPGNFGGDIARAGTQGLLAFNQASRNQQVLQGSRQEQTLRDLQIKHAQQAEAGQQAMNAAAQRNFTPGQPQMQPTDQETPSGPAGPSSFNYQGYLNDITPQNPMAALQMRQQLAAMQAKERVKLGPGETIGSYKGDKFVPDFSAPEKAPAGFTRGPNGLVADPEWLKAQQAIRAAGKPQVTVENKQEGAFAQAFGKQNAEDYSNLMKGDMAATSKLTKLGRLQSLLDQSGRTGKFTPNTMELKSAAESLGFKVDPKLPYQQAAQALSNELALEMRNPSGGAGMPGALSDSDRQFLTNMVPNLAKTSEGNALLIDTAKKLAQRDKEVAALAREYKSKTGKFDEGFYQSLADFAAKKPLFPTDPNQGWSAKRVN